MKVFDATPGATRTPELTDAASPWYRRPGILIAAAALIAEVGIVVSGPGEPGTAPDGTTRTSTPWSADFSLIATGWIPTPEPPPPPPPPPPVAEPVAPDPPAPAPRRAPTPVWEPPEAVVPPPPPPPPPSELRLRSDGGVLVVSITNNANTVGCVYRSVPVAGPATLVTVPDVNLTVSGSDETRSPPQGPATGSSFHITVTCDNGLSASMDAIY
jgi:hypothetical protein